jgi:SnoaL-like domain
LLPRTKETKVTREPSELSGLFSEFVDELNRGDGDAAVRRFAAGEEVLVIGTSTGEWLEDPKLIRDSFRREAGTLRAEFEHVKAHEEGSVGWLAARGQVTVPDGRVLPVRWTLVLHRTSDGWEILQTHLSIPDDLDEQESRS